MSRKKKGQKKRKRSETSNKAVISVFGIAVRKN